MRPQAGGGATPITPKNGFSGISRPHGRRPTIRSRSRGMLISRVSEIVGQGAGQRPDQVVAPVLPQLDVEDVDLQHVAGFGAFDRHRPGQDVAGHHPLVLGMNFVEFRRDVKLVAVRHDVRTAADGIDGHFVAAVDGQDGFQPGFEKAPMAGLGAGMQMMMGHGENFWLGAGGQRMRLYTDILRRLPLFFVLSKTLGVMLLPTNFRSASGFSAHPDGDALCLARPQARDRIGAAAGDLRTVAARQPVALSAGVALSAVGCCARRARWHHRSRRVDRSRSLGRTWHGGGERRPIASSRQSRSRIAPNARIVSTAAARI